MTLLFGFVDKAQTPSVPTELVMLSLPAIVGQVIEPLTQLYVHLYARLTTDLYQHQHPIDE